jgi:hypothetical protein
MNSEIKKFRFSDYFWPIGVSLLTGLLGLYIATLGLFAIGISITPGHGMAFVLTALGVGYLAVKDSSRIRRLRKSAVVLGVNLVACGLLALISAQFDDLSFDGMDTRIESVLGLSAGWNPVKDPSFQEGVKLAEANPYLCGSLVVQSGYQYSLGNLLSAYLVKITGSLNAGKAITPILALASFGISFGAFRALSLRSGWCWALSFLAALNPVCIYQSSSYYIDGHTGALFTAMLFSALRLLLCPMSIDGVLALVTAFLGLSAAKTSGLLYGVVIDVVFLGFYALTHLKNLKPILVFIGITVLVIWPVGVMFRKVSGFPDLSMAYLQSATNLATQGYGVGKQSYGLDVMPKLDRLQVFLMSYMAPTEIVADKVKTKFPFWLNRRELSVFEDLTPDARAGGFGPLYGAFLILAIASFGFLFLGKAPNLASCFPLVPVLLSVSLTQTWWARWAPQGWLLPISFLLPVLVCLKQQGGGIKRWVAALAVFTGLLNSGLILLFYSIGCVKAQRVLNSQLAFVKTFPQPISVYMPCFKSNRIWFIRNEIEFSIAQEPPSRPFLKMHRTETKVGIPTAWQDHLPGADLVRDWEKRKLLEK